VKYFIVHPYLSRTLSSTKYYTAYYRVTDIIINTIISSGLFWQKKEHQTKRRCKWSLLRSEAFLLFARTICSVS